MSPSRSPQFLTPGLARQVQLEQRAHFMRFHPTPSEALLWSQLRGRRLGVQFRRQVVLGQHIVDFCASSVPLVVEVDGDAYHAERTAADGRRDGKLVAAGYRLLRLPASLVERRLEDAVCLVREALGRIHTAV
jgi:very-short-patch-repair endonuclease